jgi:hypothetical protein
MCGPTGRVLQQHTTKPLTLKLKVQPAAPYYGGLNSLFSYDKVFNAGSFSYV